MSNPPVYDSSYRIGFLITQVFAMGVVLSVSLMGVLSDARGHAIVNGRSLTLQVHAAPTLSPDTYANYRYQWDAGPKFNFRAYEAQCFVAKCDVCASDSGLFVVEAPFICTMIDLETGKCWQSDQLYDSLMHMRPVIWQWE